MFSRILILLPPVKNNSIRESVERNVRNLSQFINSEVSFYKTPSSGDSQYKKSKETMEVFKIIDNKDHLFLFDERGKERTSREFADYFKVKGEISRGRAVFLVGGPYGISDELKQRAQDTIALSKLTFNSEIASLVVSEQVFRINSIIYGHPYHND